MPLRPEITSVITDRTYLWDGLSICILETIEITRAPGGGFIEGDPVFMPATAQDCCDAGVGQGPGHETSTDPCTV